MIKNKHKLGNNIFNRDKIRVTSPKLHFIISRQYPEVGLFKLQKSSRQI
jgi:hypothetical protein